jgi:hypothetical protein
VEGQTEERFVRDVLNPHFCNPRQQHMEARLIGEAKHRTKRGGKVSALAFERDLKKFVGEHGHRPNVAFTTMIDWYRLPTDFPGYSTSGTKQARLDQIEAAMTELAAHPRFVPYIQMHEFEAILFSEPQAMETQYPNSTAGWQSMAVIAAQFATPEQINDGPNTSPAKRIEQIFPDYSKVASGAIVAEKIGLEKIRSTCPNFDRWLSRLEALR